MIRHLLVLLPLLWATGLTAQSDSIRSLDPRLSDYDYPYPTEMYTFSSQFQELEMAYMDEAPTGEANGRTIVLLHGKNFNGAYWGETMTFLLEEGYRVIVPDQIGFGKSSKPARYQFTFQQLAHNTRALLTSLEVDRAIILGHSMGGMLATRFALMYPEATDRLILVNPIGLEDWKLKVPYQTVEDWYRGEMQKDYTSIKEYMRESYYAGNWYPRYDPPVELLAGWTRHPDYQQVAWNAAVTYDMIFTQPVVYEFGELRVPTVLIIGTRDRTALGKNLVSEEVAATMGRYDVLGQEVADRIPDAELIELANIGHLPQLEAFGLFDKALRQALQE
ncbi:alpha/beta fold hydrolase [Lewinella sp. IMCC34183]|uniref:alpha/beta fold hydrolase n=1 Tax=Lewinella sp. IMCC34183 TaxID=2248762 RepID=UPI0018E53C7B|nr:alpha/beta hydrolase [Lewinella sp. IMCC34183]